ncbi:MAG: ABC transporter ATP-binding protein [Lachnospiraceae bacterium]|nr:ABC transporter ATP-binding protein [Lachnospiraceae bacterium]
MEYAIEMNHIVQRFGEKEVLRGIDLKVQRGEIFGLLGPSGAGKTTLIKILTGQLCQTDGEAVLLGSDTKHAQKIHQKLGMMMDNFGLYERLSVNDNLKLFAGVYGVSRKKVDEALKKVGLIEDKKCPAMKLSKGMRSRLSLARAVMAEPEVLFLDEPTSGLDPVTASEIHQLIQQEQKRGATVFLTTHNMEEAHKLCNHVALLNDGMIVEYGEPEEVCRRYNHQNKLQIRLYDGKQIELPNNKEAADRIKEYLEEEAVETIHSTEPSLETVFMELTGRSFE